MMKHHEKNRIELMTNLLILQGVSPLAHKAPPPHEARAGRLCSRPDNNS